MLPFILHMQRHRAAEYKMTQQNLVSLREMTPPRRREAETMVGLETLQVFSRTHLVMRAGSHGQRGPAESTAGPLGCGTRIQSLF